jgi:hypothetical protein
MLTIEADGSCGKHLECLRKSLKTWKEP